MGKTDSPLSMQDVLNAVHELRLLVFLECNSEDEDSECETEGRHFHQVLLTSRQFKNVSDAIILKRESDDSLKEGYERVETRLGNEFSSAPFDGLSSTID